MNAIDLTPLDTTARSPGVACGPIQIALPAQTCLLKIYGAGFGLIVLSDTIFLLIPAPPVRLL
ncbi:hypothetical protein ASD32_28475 [Rhizobium sp. Root483D2]|nr:hypothetical protein ASD32_28475 [Rhizobium sp. Root483D2]